MKTALLLIDIQVGLDEFDYYGGERSQHNAEKNCQLLLQFFRSKRLPIFHVKHNSINEKSPLHPAKAGNKLKSEVFPLAEEPIYEKSVNSAFIGTSLEADLMDQGIKQVVIVGLTLEHCISTSVRMSANLGFETLLVGDATAAFAKKNHRGDIIPAQLVHEVSLANLQGEFAEVLSTASLIDRLEKSISPANN